MKPFSYELVPLGVTQRHLWSQNLKNIPGPGSARCTETVAGAASHCVGYLCSCETNVALRMYLQYFCRAKKYFDLKSFVL